MSEKLRVTAEARAALYEAYRLRSDTLNAECKAACNTLYLDYLAESDALVAKAEGETL